jgi:hypothetical protein
LRYYEKSLEYHRYEGIDTSGVPSRLRRLGSHSLQDNRLKLVEIPIATREKKPVSVFCVGDMLSRSPVLSPLCYLPGVITAQ